jgi:hypothetical protein
MSALGELRRIQQRDGVLTPAGVLTDARSEDSPLHRYFEWNDDAAAEKYRLAQAGDLIRRYSIQIETAPETVTRVRAFVSVAANEFVPMEQALADPALREIAFNEAVKALDSLRRKYQNLIDFDAAINQHVNQRGKGKRRAA